MGAMVLTIWKKPTTSFSKWLVQVGKSGFIGGPRIFPHRQSWPLPLRKQLLSTDLVCLHLSQNVTQWNVKMDDDKIQQGQSKWVKTFLSPLDTCCTTRLENTCPLVVFFLELKPGFHELWSFALQPTVQPPSLSSVTWENVLWLHFFFTVKHQLCSL